MQETWEDQKLIEVRTRKQKRAQRSIVVMLVIEEEEEEEEEGNPPNTLEDSVNHGNFEHCPY